MTKKKEMPELGLPQLNKDEMSAQEQNSLKGGNWCECWPGGKVDQDPFWSDHRQDVMYPNPNY